MTPLIPVDGRGLDWPRKVANAVNRLIGRRLTPFDALDTAPANPDEGYAYYDLTDHKAKVYDGTTWQALW